MMKPLVALACIALAPSVHAQVDYPSPVSPAGRQPLDMARGDVNGDGKVDGADLAYVLGYWGVCSAP